MDCCFMVLSTHLVSWKLLRKHWTHCKVILLPSTVLSKRGKLWSKDNDDIQKKLQEGIQKRFLESMTNYHIITYMIEKSDEDLGLDSDNYEEARLFLGQLDCESLEALIAPTSPRIKQCSLFHFFKSQATKPRTGGTIGSTLRAVSLTKELRNSAFWWEEYWHVLQAALAWSTCSQALA